MPPEKNNAEAALKKLGQRVRAGWAKKHPISERSRQTVRTAVREVWEQEQKAKRERGQQPPTKSKGKNKDRGQEPEI